MSDDGTSVDDADVSDAAVNGMVETLRGDWAVDSVDRFEHGTDFVARVAVETSTGDRTVVLKATTAGLVSPAQARVEPRMMELLDRETSIPVPSLYGYCDDHADYPAPFYLLEHVEGENFEGRRGDLSAEVRERVCRDAGRNVAELHELGPLPAGGTVGVRDGEIAVLDTDEHRKYDDSREMVLAWADDTLDALLDGGFFPELADDRERFADIVPPVREHLHETLPSLPEPEPPTYCHRDYRYGNLLLDPETGETRAVLDWAGTMSVDRAYTAANTESLLFDPVAEDDDRVAALRGAFRRAYADEREDWSLDAAVRERIDAYLLTNRLDAMACLPLWYQDATPAERDERAAEHRQFVARYV